MATENKGVMVYLPKDIEEYITNFCTEYNITRKDKEGNILPSLGTGVVTYLKSKMSGESPDDILTKPSKLLGTGLNKDEVLDLINEYFTSQLPSDGLSNLLTKTEVLDLINESNTSQLHSEALTKEAIETVVLDAITELSIPTAQSIDSLITTALTPLQDEISEVSEFARNLQGEIVKVKKPLAIA